MGKRKSKATPAEQFRMAINGHELIGVNCGDGWAFTCPSWPALAERWNGDTIVVNIVEEFTRRALAGAITVRRLAAGSESDG